MKFIHLSDLHIGKMLERYRLIEDQRFILDQIVDIIEAESPDAVLISGDVYDRSVPPEETVDVLGDFLVRISRITLPNGGKMQIFLSSGNHDSAERLAFCRALLKESGLHISPVYDGNIEPFVMKDEFGEVYIYMLPFLKPVYVREALKNIYRKQYNIGPNDFIEEDHPFAAAVKQLEKISSYNDAVKKAIELMNVDPEKRNIILTHQFLANSRTCDSEMPNVGGLDAIDAELYHDFNYVALGHLHTPQKLNTEGGNKNVVYYCGTPLKYSFSEEMSESVAVVSIDGEGCVDLRKIPLTPLRDLRTIRGTFDEIISSQQGSTDYIRVILEDKQLLSHFSNDLKKLFPNLVTIDTKAARLESTGGTFSSDDISPDIGPAAIFKQFFKIMNDRDMTDDEEKHIVSLIESVIEDMSSGSKGEI